MDLKEKHLDGPPKKIGRLGSRDVLQYRTKGGLFIVGATKKGGLEFLGVGPHRAVARINAEKTVSKNGDEIVWSELSKSDHVPPENYELILPEYQELTERFRKTNGDE